MNILLGVYRKNGNYGDGWTTVDPDATNRYNTHFKIVTINNRNFQLNRGVFDLKNQTEPELNGGWKANRIFPTGEIRCDRVGERKGRSQDSIILGAQDNLSYQYLADMSLIRTDFGESLKWEWNPPGIYRKVRFGPAPEHPELEQFLKTLDTMEQIAPGLWKKPHIKMTDELLATIKSL